jgi:hypothetical protein
MKTKALGVAEKSVSIILFILVTAAALIVAMMVLSCAATFTSPLL